EIWDIYVLLLTAISAIAVPLQLAIKIPFHNSLLGYEILVSVSFGIDIVLQFLTSYKEGNKEIFDHGRIARNYLRSSFLLVLIAALPLFLLQDSILSEAVPLIRSLRIVQIQRLLKLARLSSIVSDIYNRHSLNPGLLRLCYFLLLMTLAAHWL